jgi:IPT/TIG domain
MELETPARVRDSRIRWTAALAVCVFVPFLAVTPAAQAAGPAVSGVSPSAGKLSGGTNVIISGSNFSGATAVQFGASPATSFEVKSESEITAVSPAGSASVVDVTVTTPGGTSEIVPEDQFSYIPPPTVTEVSPNRGPTSGTTSVKITGTHLSGATAVQFGSSPATSFEIKSESEIIAVSPAGSASVVDVTVTTPGGTSEIVPEDQFSYIAPPIITEVSPKEGPTAGTTTVKITGTNLSGATAVQFGSSPATSFEIKSKSEITAVSPAGSAGVVDVTVTTAGGTSSQSAADQFSYVAPTSTPPSSPSTGGTAPPAITVTTPSSPLPPTKVTLPLISNLHERLIHGATLEVRFRLTVKARVRMIARRGRKVVAKTEFRTLSAGTHRLLLVLNRRRWPTKLELQSRALAPLPTISQ